MSTDFSYGGKQILSGGPFKPSGKDMPSDARTRVESFADIASIPNPHVGLKITVKVDETNNNKMTDYIVKSLKADSIGIANSLIDEVVRYVDYLGTSSNSGSVSQDDINTAVNNYFTEHPVQSGATTEQAAQIQANKTAIGDSSSGLIKEVNDIKNTELQNLNTAILGVNETLGDKSGLPSGDANVIASINRIDSKTSTGTGLTSEQISQLQTAYEHSQSSHVQASDLLNIDAVSLNGKKFSEPMTKVEYDAIVDKDPNTLYLVDDDTAIEGIPSYTTDDANKVLAVNSDGTALAWVDAPSGSGSGLTTEQVQQLTVAYNHSQSIHVSSSDIPTKVSQLDNDSNFVTREEMNSAISSADVIITTETGKKYKLIVNEDNGTLSTILLVNNGNIIVSKTDITINEGEQTEFNVYIDKSPNTEQIVSITSNNPNININPSSLSFNSSNYSEPKSVTISITKDDNYENENSIITLSSDSVEDKTINVEIIDIDIEPVTYRIEGIPTGNIFAESEVYFTVKDSKNNIIDPSQYSYTVDEDFSYKVNEGNVTGVYMWKENSSTNVTVTLPDNSTQTFTLNTGSKPTEISNSETSKILTLNTLLNSDEIELYPIYGRGDRIVYKNGLTYVRRYVKELQNITINLPDDSANESASKMSFSIDELISLNVKATTSQGVTNNKYAGKENIWIHIVGTIPTGYMAQVSSSSTYSYDCNESNKIYIMTYNKGTYFINRYRLSLDQMQNSISSLGKSIVRYITNDYEDIPVSVR